MSSKMLFQLDYLKEIGSGSDDFIRSIIEMYIEDAPKSLRAIKKSLEEKNYQTIKLYAHKLKSSSRTLHAESLAVIAADIEVAALNNNDAEIASLINKLEQPLQELTKALLAHLANS
jgi:HPt (histidine-containing phosphotransfer) domain-containing protein